VERPDEGSSRFKKNDGRHSTHHTKIKDTHSRYARGPCSAAPTRFRRSPPRDSLGAVTPRAPDLLAFA
jgi:hypothetical protein